MKVPITIKEVPNEAMFMRETRVSGEHEDGSAVELSFNAFGHGIIIQLGDRKFVLNEQDLITELDAFVRAGDWTDPTPTLNKLNKGEEE